MTLQTRRLGALEAARGMNREWTDDDEGYIAWLSTPSLLFTIWEYAERIAERRWLHEHGHVAGRPRAGGGWQVTTGDGWGWGKTTDEERDALQRAEVDALTRLLAERPLHDALRAWVNEPDERGWPALGYAMDYDAFMGRVQRERGTMAVHRNGTGSGDYGREWRRRYPDWRPDMTPDDYDRWELELITKQEGQTP